MLILTRKPGESIYIGDVKVTVVEIKGHQVRVGVDAPPEIRIYREEIYLQIKDENRKAADSSGEGLDQLVAAFGDNTGGKPPATLSSSPLAAFSYRRDKKGEAPAVQVASKKKTKSNE